LTWLQLRVLSAHPEFAEELLLAHGAQAVCQSDAADTPLLEPLPGETPLWPQTLTTGLFMEGTALEPIAAGIRELLPDGASARIDSEDLPDRDLVRVWLDSWQPRRFGQRLWVAPAEKAESVRDRDAIVMKLDPGLAFGTGTHPTTALCLEWLERESLDGAAVLDYGCGSGILAIGALLLGAQRALAVDIDPQALTAARQNAERNGVSGRLEVLASEQYVPQAMDVVVANILANPLIRLAPQLAAATRSGGRIALSGLTVTQAEAVRAAYAPLFVLDADLEKEGWVCVSGTRR
jgi:ribosomal protein L11 methyltransferase